MSASLLSVYMKMPCVLAHLQVHGGISAPQRRLEEGLSKMEITGVGIAWKPSQRRCLNTSRAGGLEEGRALGHSRDSLHKACTKTALGQCFSL